MLLYFKTLKCHYNKETSKFDAVSASYLSLGCFVSGMFIKSFASILFIECTDAAFLHCIVWLCFPLSISDGIVNKLKCPRHLTLQLIIMLFMSLPCMCQQNKSTLSLRAF